MTFEPRQHDLCPVFAAAQACNQCARMQGRRRVLSAANGDGSAQVTVVATAPGRFGAERTGVPLSGDRSGLLFDLLLQRVGLCRQQVFVTNAVICNPQDESGRNAEPSTAEIRNCSTHLRAVLDAVPAPLVLAMGATAHRAVLQLDLPRPRFSDCLGQRQRWHGRELAASYHPSPRVVASPERHAALLAQWDAIFMTTVAAHGG